MDQCHRRDVQRIQVSNHALQNSLPVAQCCNDTSSYINVAASISKVAQFLLRFTVRNGTVLPWDHWIESPGVSPARPTATSN